MMRYPKPGQSVQVRYRAALRSIASHHGDVGIVLCSASGRKTRNHLVRIGRELTVIPSGNLFKD